MPTINALLDKARETRSIASDNALAQTFGVHRQAVSKWRNGDAYPSENHIAQLAEMAGDDAGAWLVLIQAERATGKAAKAWASVAQRIGHAAAVAGLGAMYIMSNWLNRKRRSGAVFAARPCATFRS